MPDACAHCGQVHAAHTTTCPATGHRITGALTLVGEDEALVGSVVGDRYHVREILGQGTTGTVFAVEQLGIGRAAVMKVLRPRLANADAVHRAFHGEARAAWSVTHPCLCEVFDAGTLASGTPYFVMERLVGETLASRIARERLSLGAAVDVMMQLLSAIDAIHARDLLLRDLRPQNVFLAHRRGCRPLVKILDFGLARLSPIEALQQQWDSLRSVANEAEQVGPVAIPYYLSPERVRGEHGATAASDLFVAAVIFYESLTGKRPFTAGSFNGLLLQITQGVAVPLSDLRPDVSPELEALVTGAMSPDPRERPASAQELQDALRAVFEGERRASAPSRSAPLATSSPSPSHTASDATLPPRLAADLDGLYEDEQTRTDQNLVDVTDGDDVRFDEASADNPLRTVPPPSSAAVEVDIDFSALDGDPATSRGMDIDEAIRAMRARAAAEEDETETMHLTPELRARIEQMARTAREESAELGSSPPPTRRGSKPPTS